jgi:hypothetical protein
MNVDALSSPQFLLVIVEVVVGKLRRRCLTLKWRQPLSSLVLERTLGFASPGRWRERMTWQNALDDTHIA